ncbi:peptidoglycan editing factor PgeF [Permianibacter sp. IMCC34836]|uniref:peptidoglycan editing factor PgeF n=1 Tax=Permianibacter fluminis TaxID=2738515 RepID=UPI001552ADAF|nr:peptidoglycan editing factor PgeF [Permianibacter fluminis]NQD38927.1 peptidoglycan editing factor PgeF [Permianibacter fluminis]
MTTESASLELIRPDWPAPASVQAFASTRCGGVSTGAYAGLNLGAHTGDNPAAVASNRALLRQRLALQNQPHWLNQVHGVAVAELTAELATEKRTETIATVPVTADASVSRAVDTVCAVLTADCLPVLFCDRAGQWVGAAHAGWRGLCAGVLEQTLAHYHGARSELMAWLGPAIGPTAFEVGPEVRAEFVRHDAAAASAFRAGAADRWYADLYALARQRLQAAGVNAIFGGGFCTFSEPQRFYSYRRDQQTGRQATLIWRSAA